jgi:glycosyltransferase involved in cell wall biosynthesis
MASDKTVWFLPLEPLAERYTEQMLKWVSIDLRRMASVLGWKVETLLPSIKAGSISQAGQWLDTERTIEWKAAQIAMFAEAARGGRVRTNDIVLVGDAWFPGIEAVRYITQLSGVHVTLLGWHYAGMFDPADLLPRKLAKWGSTYERMLLEEVFDEVQVGSHFHRDLILASCPKANVNAGGLAWNSDDVAQHYKLFRERIVVFPHRFAPEKNPAHFVAVANALKPEFPDWSFVMSTNSPVATFDCGPNVSIVRHDSKEAYYRFLARCGVWYSAAEQETFGYSFHEAIALGIPIVAPRRCSYTEMIGCAEPQPYSKGIGIEEVRQQILDPKPYLVGLTRRFDSSTINWLGKWMR